MADSWLLIIKGWETDKSYRHLLSVGIIPDSVLLRVRQVQ
jgi:hypothetical protein